MKADIEFLEVQLENARKRTRTLELRFLDENTKVLACNQNSATCTIAQKEILVLTSNHAAEAIQEIIREIMKYEEDIISKGETFAVLDNAFLDTEIAS